METIRIRIKDLEQNTGQIEGLPGNPRQWTRAEVERIARSLQETPELFEARPLIVIPHGDKFVILGGNLRFAGCKHNKDKDVPCFVLPEDTPIDKMKEIVIKDNGSFGSWDYDALANEWDVPFEDWGVPAWETEDKPEPVAVEEDDFDEGKDEIHVRCKKGDIWQLGDHRLMCGDSTDLETVKRLMGGVLADMVFTDPPYGVAIGDKNKALQSVQKAGRIVENIANDTASVDELYKILTAAMTNVRLNCKDDACYFVTAPQGGGLGLMMMMMRDSGLEVRHNLVWRKNSPTFSIGRLDYDYQHEPIMYTWTKSHHNYRRGKYRTTIWDFDKPRKCDLHPTMKPVELVANCLLDGTREGDIVLDAFGGSGTTLVACEQLNRKCRMMELDPHYCDVIIARWEKMTGKEAVKV